ncbi:Uncharacterized protein PECH_003788 [Penicillium ucsense]|uniref:Prenylated rab acceptor 1 n=1 Tax=Penicillium ucsense TaxID=2839758 RepID=A0A8J8VW06_9EURO|nr:Uncharacterized protein PECM_003501 [Penicillium ucsense]KAF7729091.1 Uncharacterized protein PECH_003788 [Penicillium ucsense]
MGRPNRGGRAPWDESRRVEEIESEEEEQEEESAYGRELVRKARVGYERQLQYDKRGRYDYDDPFDETESIEGGEYDLYDHEDSTVAYAVQLAMRDKEDHLVDQALERIRRAQLLGRKNVRLSQRELDALERRRQQTDEGRSSGARRSRQNGAGTASRPVSRRKDAAVSEQQLPPYPSFDPEPQWNPTIHGRSGNSSAARPRTSTTQSLRPQQSASPIRPRSSHYMNVDPSGHPQPLQQPSYPRPLPDDPQWAPSSYYNPLQMVHYGAGQFPIDRSMPPDTGVSSQYRGDYSAGMPMPYGPSRPSMMEHRQSLDPSATRASRRGRAESSARSASDEERTRVEISDDDEDEDDDVQIVKVVERTTPTGFQRKRVPGTQRSNRASRTRKNR